MEFDYSHLICFSPTHSSHMIGETILRGLGAEHSTETDLTYEEPAERLEISQAVTVIVVPVYGGRVAETALERMKDIHGDGSPVIPVVVYGNRDYEDALLELCDWCVEHGFLPFAAAAFVGEHSYSRFDRPVAAGRPDEDDLLEAMAFGQEIRSKLKRKKKLNNIPALQVKGNRPYKIKSPKTPQAPLTDKGRCTQCGFCVEICPVQAIRLEEEIVTDAELCIKCCACVKQCPKGAQIFDTPFTDFLFKNFNARRQPELFY